MDEDFFDNRLIKVYEDEVHEGAGHERDDALLPLRYGWVPNCLILRTDSIALRCTSWGMFGKS